MGTKIYDNDTPFNIASKIYGGFELHQSCTIMGFYRREADMELVPKGEIIMGIIEELYKGEYCYKDGKRKNQFKPNSVGGPIAHKIFTWEKRIINNEVRYTIWRIQ